MKGRKLDRVLILTVRPQRRAFQEHDHGNRQAERGIGSCAHVRTNKGCHVLSLTVVHVDSKIPRTIASFLFSPVTTNNGSPIIEARQGCGVKGHRSPF